jgi:CBS domain-containing protein
LKRNCIGTNSIVSSIVTVVQEDGKLIGVVTRLDLLSQKLNEGFATIDGRIGIAKT